MNDLSSNTRYDGAAANSIEQRGTVSYKRGTVSKCRWVSKPSKGVIADTLGLDFFSHRSPFSLSGSVFFR